MGGRGFLANEIYFSVLFLAHYINLHHTVVVVVVVAFYFYVWIRLYLLDADVAAAGTIRLRQRHLFLYQIPFFFFLFYEKITTSNDLPLMKPFQTIEA